MKRTDLMQLYEDCGRDKLILKERLTQYFETPEGREVLLKAPPSSFYNHRGEAEQTTVNLIVDLLLQEVE